MTRIRRTRVEGSKVVIVALTVMAVLAGVMTLVSTTTAAPAAAIGHTLVEGGEVLIPAPVRSLPICQTIPDPDVGACPKKDPLVSINATGSLDASGKTTVIVTPKLPPCDSWFIAEDTFTPSPCYSSVSIARPNVGVGCIWLRDSTGELESCPGLYREGLGAINSVVIRDSRWLRRQEFGDGPSNTCTVASDFRTYFRGGGAGLPFFVGWSAVGPTALDCDLTLDGPTPDNLMGASWMSVSVRLGIKTSGTNGFETFVEAEDYVIINGFLGPDAPNPTTQDPPTDPNVPGGDPFTPLGPFTDVPTGSFARADIKLLLDLGITTGTSGTTYGPSGLVTREQMAAFLARLWRSLGNTCPDDASPFSDVSATSFARADIACISALGITTGIGGTSYGPDGLVTREQMAAFLARLWRALGNTCPTGSTPFTDISPTSFAGDDIACIFLLGITKGTSGTTYGPGDIVTREQMAAFLARTYRLQKGQA